MGDCVEPPDGRAWKERLQSLEIESPIADVRAFKVQLGIGEDAFAGNRLMKRIGGLGDLAGGAAVGGSLAGLPMVAGAFFPAGGLLGLLGLGTAATPVGWIIAAAAVSGLGWVYGKRMLRNILCGPVEVVPKFINSPIDVLAMAIFDLLLPLTLKVAATDGRMDADEEGRIRDHLAKSWGFDRSFVELGMELWAEADLAECDTREVAGSLAQLIAASKDCDYETITGEFVDFLQELIEADGRIHQREAEELALIRDILTERHSSPVRQGKPLPPRLGSAWRIRSGLFSTFAELLGSNPGRPI